MFTKEMAQRLNACDKYLPVTVYRAADRVDCTNGGITARHARLLVPHPEGFMSRAEIEARNEQEQMLEVLEPAFPGCPARFAPRGAVASGKWHMAGGNFVESCDSRFRQAYGAPVSVHDRIEEYR